MNKKEVQKRVLQNGKPLALKKFSWCEKTKTFSVKEDYLIIDFAGIGGCTFTTGWDCTFKTGWDCTWVFDWGKLQEPPLHFCGSRYYIEFSKPGFIQSGCIEKPLDWWQKNVTRCAEEHGYSLSQVREYEMYVKFLGQWMERLKLHKAKGKGEK